MTEMKAFYIFTTVVDGIERIAMHPKERVPLIYITRSGMEQDHVREYLQSVADLHGVEFHLKHFKYVETIETIETMKSRVTQ